MPYIVITTATGVPHWLRGTVFTADRNRATVYPSYEDAKTALNNAAKFYLGSAKRVIRAARIVSE